MIKIRVKIEKDLARIKAATGPEYKKFMTDTMKEQGRLLVSSAGNTPGLVQVTAPFSKGVRGIAARRQGETAVGADINKVYGSPSAMFALIDVKSRSAARGFWAAVVKKDWIEANKIARAVTGKRLQEFDDGNEHDRRRNRRGRVSGRQPSIYIAQKPSGTRDKPGPWVAAYIKRKIQNVGILAAAVVASAERHLGTLKGVPEFVLRHKSKGGGVVRLMENNRSGVTVSVENLSKRMQSDLQRKFDYVLSYRLKALSRKLPYIATYLEKKLQKQLTQGN